MVVILQLAIFISAFLMRRRWLVKDIIRMDEYFKTNNARLGKNFKAAAVPKLTSHVSPREKNMQIFALLFLCLHAGLFILGLLGALPTFADNIETIDLSALYPKAILIGLGAAIIWAGIIITLFRGTCWSNWVLVDFAITGIAGLLLTSLHLSRDANILLPQEPPHIHTQKVLSKKCILECRKICTRPFSTCRSTYVLDPGECSPDMRSVTIHYYENMDFICKANASFSYTMEITHWREAGTYKFPTEPALFDKIPVSGYVTVPVHSGALSVQWLNLDTITPAQ